MKIILVVFSVFFGRSAAASVQESKAGVVSIGEVGTYRVTVEGAEIRPKDGSGKKSSTSRPVSILSCEEDKRAPREGEKRTWEIRYSAWKAGDYDLRELLSWSEGFNQEMVKRMIVTVVDPLPAGHGGALIPAPRISLDLPLPPSARWCWAILVIWSAGLALLTWLAWIRKDPLSVAIAAQGDALRRRLLEGMRAGARSPLTPQTRAELHRQFFGLLLQDYVGAGGAMKEMLERLQRHPKGAMLLAQFDEWQSSAALRPTALPVDLVCYLEGTAVESGEN